MEKPSFSKTEQISRALRRGSLGIRQRFQSWRDSQKLEDLFSIGNTVLNMQPNGVLCVLDGFLVRFALAVATLKRRTRNEVPIGITFDNDGKSNVFHN